MLSRKYLSFCFLGIATACGGSQTDGERLEALEMRLDDLFDTRVDAQSIVAASALPATGSAGYAGPMIAFGGVGENATAGEVRTSFLGEAEMTVDFEGGTFSGSAGSFLEIANPDGWPNDDIDAELGGPVDGTLTFEGQRAASTNATYVVRATGRLEGSDGAFLDFVDVGGSGEMYGAEAETLVVRGGTDVPFDDQDGFIAYYGVNAR